MNADILNPDAQTAGLRQQCEDLAGVMFSISAGAPCQEWLDVSACSLAAWRDHWDALIAVIEVAYDVSWTSAQRVVQLVTTNWDMVAHNVDVMLDERHERIRKFADQLNLIGDVLGAPPVTYAEVNAVAMGGAL
jgi:hypothetical protein